MPPSETPDAPLTCLTCRHFHREPPPPGPVLMGTSPTGECRHSPPQTVAVASGMRVQFLILYPKVNDDFPACSHHAAAPHVPHQLNTPTTG